MRVICISGKARHGKDTVAKYMKKKLTALGNKVLIVHYADLLKYICKSFFDWDGLKDEKGRALLQYVGTDVVRVQSPDYWVGFVSSILTMFYNNWDYVLIPDCRFPNEVEYLRESGFDVYSVKIVRPDFKSDLTEEQSNHPSETAMDNYKFDYIIQNKNLTDLYSLASKLIERIAIDDECVEESCYIS